MIWLLRHGEAADGNPDAERPLTGKGEEQSRAAGAALDALGVKLSACLTSPKVRAYDTARLACEPLGIEPHVHEPLRDGFDRGEAMALLHAAGDDRRVLLVGHEPDFSQTVHDLTGARVDLKKGGVAGVRIEGGSAELIVLLRPRELDRIR